MKARLNRMVNVLIIFLLGGASTTVAALATGASRTPEDALQPGTSPSFEVPLDWPWPTAIFLRTCRPDGDIDCNEVLP